MLLIQRSQRDGIKGIKTHIREEIIDCEVYLPFSTIESKKESKKDGKDQETKQKIICIWGENVDSTIFGIGEFVAKVLNRSKLLSRIPVSSNFA